MQLLQSLSGSKPFIKPLMVMSVLMFGMGSGQAIADIYKITKEDGTVVYSDRPVGEQSSKIEVVNTPPNPIQTYPANIASQPAISQPSAINVAINDDKDVNLASLQQMINSSSELDNQTEAVHYNVNIFTPSNESAYRKPAQKIDVAVNVRPALRQGDQVVIMIDGEQVATGLEASIPTINYLPGEHTLTVKVESPNANATAQTQTRTFYIIQNTIALQNKIKLVNQLNEYYSLPWYKRAALTLSGKKPTVKKIKDSMPKVSTAFE